MFAKILQPLDMHGFPGRKRQMSLMAYNWNFYSKNHVLFTPLQEYDRTLMRIAAEAFKQQCPSLV